jgi:hypothetical protein
LVRRVAAVEELTASGLPIEMPGLSAGEKSQERLGLLLG